MTYEDFAESVVAGGLPVAWQPAVHVVIASIKWVLMQLAVAVAFRLRK